MRYTSVGIFFSLLSLFFLSGCLGKKEETFKTVKYYDSHKQIRDSRIKECNAMEDITEAILIDCDNAKSSSHNEYVGKPVQINL